MSSHKLLLWIGLCPVLWGCADGPMTEWAGMNPYYRREWEQDAIYGPNFHDRLAELRAIRSNPQALDGNERQQVIDLLATIIRESDNAVLRTEAILTLGSLPSPKTEETLRFALNDSNVDVRVAACRAWGRVGGAGAVPALAKVVESDAHLDVRMAATTELARFQDQEAIQALGIALDDDNPALQHRAVQSLRRATGLNFGDSVPAWRDYVAGRTPRVPDSPGLAERIMRLRWF